MSLITASEWRSFLKTHPRAHLLQTAEWGTLKAEGGWQVERVQQGDLGAQILFQPLPLGMSVAYIPRGPVVPEGDDWPPAGWDSFLSEVDQVCEDKNAVFLKIEPDFWEGGFPDEFNPPRGFRSSAHAIQPPRSLVISLKETEEEILGRMKSKTRYNIRLAKRKDIVVHRRQDLALFYPLLESTAERADFGIHDREYYRQVFDLLHPQGSCALFVASYQEQPLASIMVFLRGKRSWYFYGASSPEHRDRMPTYRVQWEAMRWAKAQGCTSYDLWGVPDYDFDTLEDQFLERSDGLWGVYRFKRGFGGELKRTCGPWDRVYSPLLYRFYRWWAARSA